MNQNNLSNKIELMEKKHQEENLLIEKSKINREERLTEIVTQLGEEITN